MNEEKTIHISPPKYIEWAAIGALVMLGLFLLVSTLDAFDELGRSETPAVNTITVTGEGKVTRPPDIARITFTVQNTASTVAKAQADTVKEAGAAIDFVKKTIPEKDIKTASYSVNPQYEYGRPCPVGAVCPPDYYNGTPRITGYQVSQTVQVTVRDLDKVSELLGGLGEFDVQNLYGPELALDNPNDAQNDAREEAITEAREQAQALARQLGVRLVRIVSFSDGGRYPIYYAKDVAYGMGAATAESAPAPEIPMGENEYVSNVSITYEIR